MAKPRPSSELLKTFTSTSFTRPLPPRASRVFVSSGDEDASSSAGGNVSTYGIRRQRFHLHSLQHLRRRHRLGYLPSAPPAPTSTRPTGPTSSPRCLTFRRFPGTIPAPAAFWSQPSALLLRPMGRTAYATTYSTFCRKPKRATAKRGWRQRRSQRLRHRVSRVQRNRQRKLRRLCQALLAETARRPSRRRTRHPRCLPLCVQRILGRLLCRLHLRPHRRLRLHTLLRRSLHLARLRRHLCLQPHLGRHPGARQPEDRTTLGQLQHCPLQPRQLRVRRIRQCLLQLFAGKRDRGRLPLQ